ncbi:MAG: D-alanine--D-alanine ligase [Alicyclobacillus sp.]|nr:D-alanine--D-alanine ligase [Alicyclobacillus sp.]
MAKRIRVGVMFGGKSGEHEVSIQSAQSLIASLDPEKYIAVPIGIDKAGRFSTAHQAIELLYGAHPVALPPVLHAAVEVQDGSMPAVQDRAELLSVDLATDLDVIVPVLHGSYGEDGTIQGLLELMNIPYVGAGVLASAVGMDKVFMKRVFAAAGLPQVNYTYTTRRQWETDPDGTLASIEASIGYPCFVKPANLGSSVGISKAKDRPGLVAALNEAARYDRKIIIEEGLQVREIEVAVLGNDHPRASVPGEVKPSNEFYDYRAKYIDGESELIIPADLPADLTEAIRDLAVRAFLALDCSGLARVDFFLEKETDRVLVNEINTMPGFTRFSMYPKLWEASGLSYSDLIDTLIELAVERHAEKQRNVTSFSLD